MRGSMEGSGGFLNDLLRRDRGDETVPAFGNGLDVAGCVSRVAECSANMRDREVQPALEIDVSTLRPDLLPQLVPAHDFSGPAHKNGQDARWLGLKPNGHPAPRQRAGSHFKAKRPKLNAVDHICYCQHTYYLQIDYSAAQP